MRMICTCGVTTGPIAEPALPLDTLKCGNCGAVLLYGDTVLMNVDGVDKPFHVGMPRFGIDVRDDSGLEMRWEPAPVPVEET